MPAIVASSTANSGLRVVGDWPDVRSAFSGDMAMLNTTNQPSPLARMRSPQIAFELLRQRGTPLVPVGRLLIGVGERENRCLRERRARNL